MALIDQTWSRNILYTFILFITYVTVNFFNSELCIAWSSESLIRILIIISMHFLIKMQRLSGLLVCIFALFALRGFCHDDESAHLLASKSVLNNLLVEEKDLTVQYDIYNVGSRYGQQKMVYLKWSKCNDKQLLSCLTCYCRGVILINSVNSQNFEKLFVDTTLRNCFWEVSSNIQHESLTFSIVLHFIETMFVWIVLMVYSIISAFIGLDDHYLDIIRHFLWFKSVRKCFGHLT